MRTAMLLARTRGEAHLKVISGPEVVYVEQVSRWRELMTVSHDFDVVELWESDSGVARRKRFRPQAEVASPVPESDLLTESVMAMSDEELVAYAAAHQIDLTGLTARVDIVTAIVMAVRFDGVKPYSDGNSASADDPGVFQGPALPSGLLLPGTV